MPLRENDSSSGHAAEFLQTIETVIMPFIEREYRADPSCRVMAGASLGGLFTLYAIYTKPELFKRRSARSTKKMAFPATSIPEVFVI